jgi:hypothetical protein
MTTYWTRRNNNQCTGCGGARDSEKINCLECRRKVSDRCLRHQEEKKRKGICRTCTTAVDTGRSYCKECASKQITSERTKRDKRVQSGLCALCKTSVEEKGATLCAKCRASARESVAARTRKKMDGGVCVDCDSRSMGSPSRYCFVCWIKHRVGKHGKTMKESDLVELWEEQKGTCCYTGIALTMGGKTLDSASIDHKIPTKRGGTNEKSNLQWVSVRANLMKGNLTHEEFLSTCQTIVGRRSNGPP